MEAKFCPQCGTPRLGNFCGKCGFNFKAHESINVQSADRENSLDATDSSQRILPKGLIMGEKFNPKSQCDNCGLKFDKNSKCKECGE